MVVFSNTNVVIIIFGEKRNYSKDLLKLRVDFEVSHYTVIISHFDYFEAFLCLCKVHIRLHRQERLNAKKIDLRHHCSCFPCHNLEKDYKTRKTIGAPSSGVS